jgi:hypothetical protein
MKNYFINPNKKPAGNKLITNEAEFDKQEYFLNEIEEVAPQVCEQLNDLVPFYNNATDIAIKRNKEGIDTDIKWPQEWQNLQDAKIEEFKILTNLLYQWATNNYLIGDKIPERFMIVALSAIDEYCYRIKDKEYHELLGEKGDPKISLVSGLEHLINDEPDDFQEEQENFPFNRIFPFVFSPTIEEWIYGERHFNDENFGEHILRHDKIKTELLKIPQEESERYAFYTENWGDGAGWDPRATSWKEFEEKINLLFENYKTRYKQRTEKFLIDNYGFSQSTIKKRQDHFKWLVLSQLEGMTARQIIEHLKLSVVERTVSDALEKSAAEIDLKPREKNKGGRPRNK